MICLPTKLCEMTNSDCLDIDMLINSQLDDDLTYKVCSHNKEKSFVMT